MRERTVVRDDVTHVYRMPGEGSRLCVTETGQRHYSARVETIYETLAEREYYGSGAVARERLGRRTTVIHELGGLAGPAPEPLLLVGSRTIWGLIWRTATSAVAVWLGFCSLWFAFGVGGIGGRIGAVGAAILSCQLLYGLGQRPVTGSGRT